MAILENLQNDVDFRQRLDMLIDQKAEFISEMLVKNMQKGDQN